MDIPSIVYQRFYEVLYKFFSEEVIKIKGVERVEAHLEVWEYTNPETGKRVFDEIFDTYLYDARHFYKKKGMYVPSKVSLGYMKDPVIIRAFEFMGLNIPTSLKKKTIIPSVKASILYQFFLEKYMPDYWEENKGHLKFFDHEANQIVYPDVHYTSDGQNKDAIAFADSDKKQVDSDGKSVEGLIKAFYRNVSNSEYEEAWKLLSPSFQRRVWESEFERFRIGYTHTVSIHDIHVFDLEKDDPDIKCKIYYESDTITYSSLDLSNLSKVTVEDVEEFSKRVKKIQQKADKVGLVGFEKIEILKFFEPGFSEYAWYKCGRNPEIISQLLGSQETLTIPRLQSVTCGFIKDKWLIKSITPVKAHPIR